MDASEYLGIVARPLFVRSPGSYERAMSRVGRLVEIPDDLDLMSLAIEGPDHVLEDAYLRAVFIDEGASFLGAYLDLYLLRRAHNALSATVWFERDELRRGIADRAHGERTREAMMVSALEWALAYEPAFPTRRNGRARLRSSPSSPPGNLRALSRRSRMPSRHQRIRGS